MRNQWEKQNNHGSLPDLARFEPVQIWPEPVFGDTKKQTEKLQPEIKITKTQEANQDNRGKVNKFYKFIVIFAIICAIFSNGYFVFTKLAQSSTPKSISMTFPDSLFQNVIRPDYSNDLPVRLIIPSINVDASIQQIGQTPEGTMDVPNNTSDVGWYKFGAVPGQNGTAIIDAHVDDANGLPAVFGHLYTLKEGDSIIVQNDKNKSIYFTVKKVTTFSVNDKVSDIIGKDDGAHLDLITCTGSWDMSKKTYTQRLIVSADLVQP